MKDIISKNSTILGIALVLVLHLTWANSQVASQSVGRTIGNIVGGAAGAVDGAISGANAGGDVGSNLTSGASANLTADFRASLGTNGDSPSPLPNGDNNNGQQASRSGQESSPTTAKPENFFNKMKDMFTSGSSSTSPPNTQQQISTSSATTMPQSFTEALKGSGNNSDNNSTSTTTSKPEPLLEKLGNKLVDMSRSSRDSLNHTIDSSRDGTSRSGNETNSGSEDGLGMKLSKTLNRSADLLKETGNKFGERASEIGDKARNFTSRVDSAIHNFTSPTDGSSNNNKNMTQSMKDFINNNKAKADAGGRERSDLRDDDSKNVMVELFDKAHELSKMPMETLLKPLDKILGVDKDPLLKMMDTSHDVLRKPLDKLTKPMGMMLDGAFKTSDEIEQEEPNLPEQKKKGNSQKEMRKNTDRSVMGDIVDKAVELAESPLELVLKPFDKLLGNGDKKNPLLRFIDELYNLSKKPVDRLAKPFEEMLRKMANGYQLSVEYNDVEDPKLVTRLADGALNVADRVVTKPIELAMNPLSRILGYESKHKKNSIVEAAHAWKNATRLGLELLTKPIDRIIKEIADLGDIKDDEEREEEYKRRREEASRLVELLDKIHDAAQVPFEIVFRPVDLITGSRKKGHKQAVLRAWDLLHYVLRVPIQVVSKPVEDAILGERTKKPRMNEAYARVSSREGNSRSGLWKHKKDRNKGEDKKNFFVDNIKKAEKFAVKPLELLSMPMRRLILGRLDKKNHKSEPNARVNANADSNGLSNSGTVNDSSNNSDKIVTTIEKMNNVLLAPMQLLTQPIADKLFSKKGGELKIDARVKTNFIPNSNSSSTAKPQQRAPTTTSTTNPIPQTSSPSKDKKDDKQIGFNSTMSAQAQVSKG